MILTKKRQVSHVIDAANKGIEPMHAHKSGKEEKAATSVLARKKAVPVLRPEDVLETSAQGSNTSTHVPEQMVSSS